MVTIRLIILKILDKTWVNVFVTYFSIMQCLFISGEGGSGVSFTILIFIFQSEIPTLSLIKKIQFFKR